MTGRAVHAAPPAFSPATVAGAVATGALLAAAAAGVPLAGPAASLGACAAIAMFGMPHGALDIALVRHAGTARRGPVLALYIAAAALAALAWLLAPAVALVLFVVIAVVHFAEDWDATDAPFLALGLGLATIAAPALFHRGEVAAIFVALTGTDAAALVADALLVVAPVALAVAIAGIVAMAVAGRFDRAAAAATGLVALLALPPIVGFAVFFCLIHSPRHFGEALRTLAWLRVRQWLPVVAPIMLAALAIVTGLYLVQAAAAVPMRLTAALFMALSILTVPHMIVPPLAATLWRGRTTRHQFVAGASHRRNPLASAAMQDDIEEDGRARPHRGPGDVDALLYPRTRTYAAQRARRGGSSAP